MNKELETAVRGAPQAERWPATGAGCCPNGSSYSVPYKRKRSVGVWQKKTPAREGAGVQRLLLKSGKGDFAARDTILGELDPSWLLDPQIIVTPLEKIVTDDRLGPNEAIGPPPSSEGLPDTGACVPATSPRQRPAQIPRAERLLHRWDLPETAQNPGW